MASKRALTSDEPKKELEEKVVRGISAGLIGNAVVLLALGIAIGATKGRILRRFL